MDTPEFLPVPTPREFVGQVYGLLARLMADGGNGVGIVEGDSAAVEPGAGEVALTPDLVRRMYEESLDPHRKLFKYLAKHPDEWIHSDALAKALQLGSGNKSLAGMLGAFGRRAKHRYNGLRPFVSEWDGSAGQVRHRMTAEVAKVVAPI